VGPHRPDLIICDDIEKDALVERASNRAKLEHWLRKAVLPALAPRGRLVLLGSILHHDSLLAKMRDRKLFPGWDYRVYRAVEPELRADGSWVLNALWPARWPLERLEQERERIGSIAFEQEYMANPVDTSLRVFTPEMLKRYEEGELAGRDLATLVAVDPATGSEGGDFFAVWVGSVDLNDGTIFTRELLLERIDFRAQVRRIREVCERWQPLKVGIESNAYQKSLLHSVEEMGRAYRLYVPLVEIRSVTRKELRIEAVAPLFESGVFRLPVQLDPEAELQFLQFPRAAHDDGPDVCAMGVELARSLRPMACAAPATGRVANSTWRGW
jgi:predicted phage terminase large subunit-like protein